MDAITLPHSGVKINFVPDFDPDKLADFTRQVLKDPELAKQVRANPAEELGKLGILIDEDERKKITDEDLLRGMGLRAKENAAQGDPGETQLAPAVVIIAVVILFGSDG